VLIVIDLPENPTQWLRHTAKLLGVRPPELAEALLVDVLEGARRQLEREGRLLLRDARDPGRFD
jgi:hypothetical protein